MDSRKTLAQELAVAMLDGSLAQPGLLARCKAIIDGRAVWLKGLTKRIIAYFGEGTRPRRFRLERFILADARFLKAGKRGLTRIERPAVPPKMCPAKGPPSHWNLPSICTIGELAQRLNVTPNELAWFADLQTREAKLPPGPLRHYHYRWQEKSDGGARLIESPKQRLKAIQRFLLREVINQIPPHEAAHGFRAGRSIRTFVAGHVNRTVVLKLDLKDFFPSITRARVLAIFLTAGYPESVAEVLAGLCTNNMPSVEMKHCPLAPGSPHRRPLKLLYQRAHLPQGAPTSPALANLALYRLDCRLSGLAKAVGSQYTRYADDLVFSGGDEFSRMVGRFYIRVCAIVLEQGFEVHTRKTRIMRQSVSQRAAGVVLNQHMNSPRAEYDRLKAILHNCVVLGLGGQNRNGTPDFWAHLAGRIAHVAMLNPARGEKLRAEFERIDWGAEESNRE